MSVFADSSAVVKLYADEPGATVIRALDAALVVSRLTRVEVPSALWRKARVGAIGGDDAGLLVLEFEADWRGTRADGGPFLPVAATAQVCAVAARLVAAHGLRAYDAVQLATAVQVRDLHAPAGTFACFDRDLRAAAAAEGFALLP